MTDCDKQTRGLMLTLNMYLCDSTDHSAEYIKSRISSYALATQTQADTIS